jgi:multisubunit Na+/H+ antiporter MnhC subunit
VIDVKENAVDLVIRMALISVGVVLLFMVVGSHQHGMLMDPVNRSSMWRKGYKTPENYEDNQLFCGGRSVSWNVFV